MSELRKSFSGEPIKADARKDIDLINKYALRELKPEEVFSFNVNLCDDQIDRDNEAFTVDSLRKMAKLFVGKPLIQDHFASASNQQGRIYKTQLVQDGPVNRLRASIYMVRTSGMEETIAQIEGGILREVSVCCAIKRCSCSRCGEEFSYDWQSGKLRCKNGHIKGEKIDGQLIYGKLEDPIDAFEVSLVAVPAQREAGVTKGRKSAAEMSPEEAAARKRMAEAAVHVLCAQSSDGEKRATAKVNHPGSHEGPGTIPFAIVPESAVNLTLRKECTVALAFAREELGLPQISIKYFMPLSSLKKLNISVSEKDVFQNSKGCAGTIDVDSFDRIYIRADYSDSFAETVLHECYHVMQNRNSASTGIQLSLGEIEKNAYQYGRDAMIRFKDLSTEEREQLYMRELLDIE